MKNSSLPHRESSRPSPGTGRLAPLLLLAAAACYPKEGPPPATPSGDVVAIAQKRWPDATEASLNEGRSLFLAQCNRCHGYPDLRLIEPGKLAEDTRRMARNKSDLSEPQAELVVRFVLASRESK